jgi:hypothetical protein
VPRNSANFAHCVLPVCQVKLLTGIRFFVKSINQKVFYGMGRHYKSLGSVPEWILARVASQESMISAWILTA